MANSIFAAGGGKDQYHGGTFRAEDIKLTWTGVNTGEGALVQEAQWRCQRQINTLYEIGSPAVYYVGNRRSGQASMRRVVAGRTQFRDMARKFGDLCNPDNLVIGAAASACGANSGGVNYTLVAATLSELGASVQAEQIVINENMGFVFVDLYYTEPAGGGARPRGRVDRAGRVV
jgi:hypothetical protein